MRVAVMVISLVLMLAILLQSFAAGVGSGLSNDLGQKQAMAVGGWTGLLVALLYLLGGAFALGLPRAAAVVFVTAGVVGLAGGTSTAFKDLTVWGVIAFVLAGMSFFGWRDKRRSELRQVLERDALMRQVMAGGAVAGSASASTSRPIATCLRCGTPVPSLAQYCPACGLPQHQARVIPRIDTSRARIVPPPDGSDAIRNAVLAGGALLVASGIYLVLEVSAGLRVGPGFAWGFWFGALGGLLVWLWGTWWMWRHAGRRWAIALFFGSFVALAAYAYRQNGKDRAGATDVSLPRFPTARLCGGLLGVALVAAVVAGPTGGDGRLFKVIGTGMEPALTDGEEFLVVPWADHAHPPARGDIVVFEPPGASHGRQIKRVVGLPNERMTFRNGDAEVDGRRLPEPYIDGPITQCAPGEVCAVLIPEGAVYVLGDNRTNSTDSRSFGPVAIEQITGRAAVVAWPLGEIHRLPRVTYSYPDGTEGILTQE